MRKRRRTLHLTGCKVTNLFWNVQDFKGLYFLLFSPLRQLFLAFLLHAHTSPLNTNPPLPSLIVFPSS